MCVCTRVHRANVIYERIRTYEKIITRVLRNQTRPRLSMDGTTTRPGVYTRRDSEAEEQPRGDVRVAKIFPTAVVENVFRDFGVFCFSEILDDFRIFRSYIRNAPGESSISTNTVDAF